MIINQTYNIRLGRTLLGVLPVVLLSVLFQSCFTGIESTPKITYKDVRKQVTVSPEQVYARNFRFTPFSAWQPGRQLLLTDSRGALTYLPLPGQQHELSEGDTLVYQGVRTLPSILGTDVEELIFSNLHQPADTFTYRLNVNIDETATKSDSPLPFLVDLDMVVQADLLLRGKELFTRSDRWYSGGAAELNGRKFLKVMVDSVIPASENYPYLVMFHSLEADGQTGGMLMAPTAQDEVATIREFNNLFYLENPRTNYPNITDARWELIRLGRVEIGMTAQEAQLSLGAPKEVDRRPDQSILYERWSYPGGIFLIFEDGILTRTNL